MYLQLLMVSEALMDAGSPLGGCEMITAQPQVWKEGQESPENKRKAAVALWGLELFGSKCHFFQHKPRVSLL